MAQVGQRTRDAIITPTPVFAGQPDDQGLKFRRHSRAAGISTMPGSVELLGSQASVPAENGIRLGHLRDVFQRFTPKPFGNLAQRDSLWIRKPQPHRQMAAQNTILSDQVLVAEQ